MRDITSTLPIVQQQWAKVLDECKQVGEPTGWSILGTSFYRTIEEQDALYAQGRTIDGTIITKAKGGQSMHNYKVAIDFCIIKNGKADWDDLYLYRKAGEIAKKYGFEYGGDWVQWKDNDHIQYTLGYTLTNFQNSDVDYTKFDIAPIVTYTQTIAPAVEPEIAPTSEITVQGILSSKTIWLGAIIAFLQSMPADILPPTYSHYITVILGVLVVINRFLTKAPVK